MTTNNHEDGADETRVNPQREDKATRLSESAVENKASASEQGSASGDATNAAEAHKPTHADESSQVAQSVNDPYGLGTTYGSMGHAGGAGATGATGASDSQHLSQGAQGTAGFNPYPAQHQTQSAHGSGFSATTRQPAGSPAAPSISPSARPDVAGQSRSFISALFDFSFSQFITLGFAKLIYIVAVVATAVLMFFTVIGVFATVFSGSVGIVEGIFVFIFGLFAAIVGGAINLIVVRLVLELAVSIIRLAQNSTEIKEELRRRNI